MRTRKYKLQKSVDIAGVKYEIRTEYSVIISILEALKDCELSDQERTYVLLNLFYPAFDEMPEEHYFEALSACFQYINGGEKTQPHKKEPTLVDWEQDFPLIVNAVNRVLGYDIRGVEYDYYKNEGGVPWETFISAYMEIGDCFFAQVVRIRDKKARGKALDKQDREFYRRNRDVIDLKTTETREEKEILAAWGIST